MADILAALNMIFVPLNLLGLAFGVDYQIENFHVGVSYDLGLKDINAFAKDMNDEAGYTPIKNRTALFTLGFDF